ncbi:hypothetical protein ACVJGD_002327 [Bradyrhizobium sp. USDA 10063]
MTVAVANQRLSERELLFDLTGQQTFAGKIAGFVCWSGRQLTF